jgi:hypothetical protein
MTRLSKTEWEALKAMHHNKCVICGKTEKVVGKLQRAHLKAKSKGGTQVVPMCANDHSKYDNNLLTKTQLKKLGITDQKTYASMKPKKSMPKKSGNIANQLEVVKPTREPFKSPAAIDNSGTITVGGKTEVSIKGENAVGIRNTGTFMTGGDLKVTKRNNRRITMAEFGGSKFINCSVPLAFQGRYFVLESGNPPLLSVVLEHYGKPVFEIKKNTPSNNPLTDVVISATGIITVSEKATGRFLYKFRPTSETSIVFGKIDGGEISAKITDKLIQVGGLTIKNMVFNGVGAGIIVDEKGGVGIGAPIPKSLLQLFEGKDAK